MLKKIENSLGTSKVSVYNWCKCHWNKRLRFMTMAKVILHGAFLARVSVCGVPVCAPTPGNASPTYLPSTHSRSPRSLGASEKAAKAPAESRGKPVEGAAAAPKSHRRGLRIQIPLPPSGIPAAPSFQQQLLLEWR